MPGGVGPVTTSVGDDGVFSEVGEGEGAGPEEECTGEVEAVGAAIGVAEAVEEEEMEELETVLARGELGGGGGALEVGEPRCGAVAEAWEEVTKTGGGGGACLAMGEGGAELFPVGVRADAKSRVLPSKPPS